MRIYKVITAVIVTAASFKSCDIEIPFVTKDALEFSQNETKEVRQELQAVQGNYTKQIREFASILNELTELSCQTTTLQMESEYCDRQLTQAEKISGHLDAIRNRIDRLEKEAKRAGKLDKDMEQSVQTIRNLRKIVDNQKREIDRLKDVINNQENTIRTQSAFIAEQKVTIDGQKLTIQSKEAELQRLLDKQTEKVYEAGLEFERLGDRDDQSLDVSGKRNKEKIRTFKRSIYEKAGQFYREAANANHSEAAGRCEVISYKLSAL